MQEVAVAAAGLPDEAVQGGIDLPQPAPVVDAVGDILELPGLHGAGVLENVLFQDLGVQGGDTVDSHAPRDAEVRHPHLAAPEDGQLLGLGGIVEEALHLLLPAPGDLLQDLPDSRQQALHQLLGPALQGLRQDGVVGVGHGVRGDVPGLVPAHPRLVDEDAHQLRDHQGRVGVVDLEDVLLVEVLQGPVHRQMLRHHGLHRGGDEEVLLL